jgi:hypothetical protein
MKKKTFTPTIDPRAIYDQFSVPATLEDCGQKCSRHNPSGKPFCCDICHAIPAAYHQEWAYFQKTTQLWQVWRGDECPEEPARVEELRQDTPDHMLLLACLGPQKCERSNRALSCRQFPFFPYVSSDYRFLGLAYEWEFEDTCWVISNLSRVTAQFRQEFIQTYDRLFALWQEEFDSYALRSEQMREHFASQRRRILLLHRNGHAYLVSPRSERQRRVRLEDQPRFGFYKGASPAGTAAQVTGERSSG